MKANGHELEKERPRELFEKMCEARGEPVMMARTPDGLECLAGRLCGEQCTDVVRSSAFSTADASQKSENQRNNK
ncbi:MAG: hypothetical protein GX192_01165 [Clostridiales bacterium]|nr:hypothetical protein [Clostridiales bacterium]